MNFEAQTFLAVFMCGLTLAAWLLPTLAGTLRELWRRYAALGGAEATFIAALVLCAVYVGGTKPTNMQSQAQSGGTANTVMTGGAARMSVTGGGEPQRLSTNQYLAGFALVGAATHTVPWLDVPSNAVAHFPWTRHGVAEDTFWLPAANWSFVLGTNAVEGAHVSSSGTLSFGTPKGSPRAAELPDGDRLSFLAPLQASLGTVPPQGRFWHAATPSNSLLFTWQDVYAGRDTNSPVTFQAELFRNGDFTYRYAFTNAPALTNFVVGAQHSGGGETYAFNDTGKLANGLELRWRAFSLLDPSVSDHDGDGVSTYDEVMAHGTCPSMTDTDGDGLEDADELILGTGPLDPDTDGDLAADSTDPDPLTPDDPDTIMNCCSNTWLFHVHHALPTNGTCGASGFPYDYNLFAVTVTLNAPVIAPGAVLWIGGTPLVMRDPGSWTLWLDKETAKAVRLCAPRGVEVDYTVSADEYGFFIQPPPPEPVMPPLSHTATPEGTIAVPFFSIEPSYVCFHGAPVTFRAVGCAAGLSGQYVWTYGNTTVVTNAPEFTVSPDGGGSAQAVSVTFLPDGLDAAAPARAAAGAGARSAADGWPAGTACGCGYCQRHTALNGHTIWWCGLTGRSENEDRCPAAGRGYIPPVDGTNTFFTLPVPRRPAAWPDGYATLSPWPSGHAGQGTPPNDPDDCGHDSGCSDCEWVVDHWHRKEETFKWLDHCGCCDCPEHNPTAAGEPQSSEPVVYEGAAGLTAAFRPFEGGGTVPLSLGPLPGPGVVAVTGLTPSSAPYDRSVSFSRHFPSLPATFYEVDRFTVLSLDLQPDLDLDGSVGSADAAALAADWDRKWLIPAGTNAFPLKVFNDVALPGVYTLAVDGPSNIVARYGNVTVRGGESNAVAFPPGSTAETVLVQADGPGEAVLAVSFKGTGDAAGFECETQVEIKAYARSVDFLVNGTVATNRLQVAKWENAFSNACVQVGNYTVTNAVFRQSEFISTDTDRFRVRVTDEYRADAESIEVTLWAESPDSEYDAAARVMTLPRVSPGVFMSTNLLLVSDWYDAVFDAAAYGVAPDSPDRLFLSQLSGSVCASYIDGWGQTNTVSVSIGVDVKSVGVDVAIMRTNGVACIDTLTALAQVTLAKERFAQANITVEMGSLVFFDAPPQVDVEQWYVVATNNPFQLTQEARSVVHGALAAVTNGTSNRCLIFVPCVRDDPDYQIAGLATAKYRFVYPIDSAYTDHCIISANQIEAFVSAHELCHVLGIRNHVSEKCNLMFSSASPFTDVCSSKRLFAEQTQTVRSGDHVQ